MTVHQPYEDWLFSAEPLTSQQAAELQEHLEECDACRQLASAWQEVEAGLQALPEEAPQPGFSTRWQARVEADRQRLHRRQSLAVLGFSQAGAFLLFASLAILLLPLLNVPSLVVWSLLQRLFTLSSLLQTAQGWLGTLVQSATGGMTLVGWMLFMGLITELGVLWVVTYRWITQTRRVTQ